MRAEFGTSSGWQQLEGGSKGAGTNHPAATVMQLVGKGAFEAWVDPRRHKKWVVLGLVVHKSVEPPQWTKAVRYRPDHFKS